MTHTQLTCCKRERERDTDTLHTPQTDNKHHVPVADDTQPVGHAADAHVARPHLDAVLQEGVKVLEHVRYQEEHGHVDLGHGLHGEHSTCSARRPRSGAGSHASVVVGLEFLRQRGFSPLQEAVSLASGRSVVVVVVAVVHVNDAGVGHGGGGGGGGGDQWRW